jgi:hypothetical protein
MARYFTAMEVLIALQGLVVLFVGLHNWIPVGSLNDLQGVREVFPTGKLVMTTLTNLVPAAIGLGGSIYYFSMGWRLGGWLIWYLWAFYLLACYGSLKAWWIPYFAGTNAERVARERTMYAQTHAFLPERNGVRPNTLHVAFDVLTVAILAVLGIFTAGMR